MATKKRVRKSDINYGYDSAFPSVLRELLQEHTQEELAQCVGVQRQAIAQWKDGKTKPDVYYLSLIADFFEVTTDYLLGKTDVRKADASLRTACEYSGLNEDAMQAIREQGKETMVTAPCFLNELTTNEFFHDLILTINGACYYLLTEMPCDFDSLDEKQKQSVDEATDMLREYGFSIIRTDEAAMHNKREAVSLFEDILTALLEKRCAQIMSDIERHLHDKEMGSVSDGND